MGKIKKTISAILLLTVILLCFSGCRPVYATSFSHYTDFDGVYITVDEISADEFGETLTVTWHNDTDHIVTYGLDYTVEFYKNGEWGDIQLTDFAIPEIACILSPHSTMTQKYTTKYFNTFAEGDYRIRVGFLIENESGCIGGSSFAPFAKGYK